MTSIAALPSRAVIEIAGEDRIAFLQGIVSNDVEQAAAGRAVWAAFLTPQGKYLADFFIFAEADRLLLDVEAAQAPMLLQKLGRFRLRAKVTLSERPDLRIYAAWPDAPPPDTGAIAAPDPRMTAAGWRILSAHTLDPTADEAAWNVHRIALGLPDGTHDLEPEKSVLLEAGFDELGGISWTKGCYMGQELTARTRYRGLVKRRLVPVSIEGPAPAPGTAVFADGAEVGTLRSVSGAIGLAAIRLDAFDKTLDAGEAKLTPHVPDWLRMPEKAPTPA